MLMTQLMMNGHLSQGIDEGLKYEGWLIRYCTWLGAICWLMVI